VPFDDDVTQMGPLGIPSAVPAEADLALADAAPVSSKTAPLDDEHPGRDTPAVASTVAAPTLPKPGDTVAERFEIVRSSGSAGDVHLLLARDRAPWRGCWSCGQAADRGIDWCCCGYGLDIVDVQVWLSATPGPAWGLLSDPAVAALAPVVQGPFAAGALSGWATRVPVIGQPSPPLPEREVAAWLGRAVAAFQVVDQHAVKIGPIGIADLTESRGPLRLNHLMPLVVPPDGDGITSADLAALAFELATGSGAPSTLTATDGDGALLSPRFRRVLVRTLAGSLTPADIDAELAQTPASFTAGMATQIGPSHVRNDDCALVSTSAGSGEAGLEPAGLFVVADGVSQGGRGAEASHLAVATFREIVSRVGAAGGTPSADEDVTLSLGRLAAEASMLTHERLAERFGAGAFRSATTLVGLIVSGKAGLVFHLGDSRAYLLRRDRFRRLTDDHSPVFQAVLRGELTPEAAAEHPARSAISRYIGNDSPREPESSPVSIVPGDRVLLCSDGIWSVLDDELMAATVAAYEPLVAARRLVELALAAGTHDDSTAVVVRADATLPDAGYDATRADTGCRDRARASGLSHASDNAYASDHAYPGEGETS
jgi:protein phosphatase